MRVITLGTVVMLESCAKEEEMEIEGTGTTAVKIKSYYGWPLFSPLDVFSGAMIWTDWMEHFEAMAVLSDLGGVARLGRCG